MDTTTPPEAPPVRRCVGAFLRPCVILTDAILCEPCWRPVDATSPEALMHMDTRPRLTNRGWAAASWWTASGPHRRARFGDPALECRPPAQGKAR